MASLNVCLSVIGRLGFFSNMWIFTPVCLWGSDKDKEALFNVAYTVTDNISS